MTTHNPVTRADPGGTRLDLALVRRGLARSRTQAQSLIAGGGVTVNGSPAGRSAEVVTDADDITARPEPYVSRAAYKLIGALDDLGLQVAGRRALDAGASTGGFTQVLLERGCREVFAVDVGSDQLDPRIRNDPRVRVRDQINLRGLTLDHLEQQPVDLVVADVSFISLRLLVAPLTAALHPDGNLLLMIKPQFEVGRARLGRGGVVREPEHRQQAVTNVLAAAAGCGWTDHRVVPSRRPGASGNQEFFALIRRRPAGECSDEGD